MKKPEKIEGITMTPVKSSNIKAVGHDGRSSLIIEFHTGKSYRYDGVNKDLHESLISAESIGSFFAKNIKGNPEISWRPSKNKK